MNKNVNLTSEGKRYKRLINFLTDYIYTVNIDNGKVKDTYHGPGCFSVTGYSSDDYKNDPKLWYRMVYEKDREIVTEQASNALKGNEVEPLEHRIVHRNGSIRWVRNTIVISKDDEENVLSYDGLITDITDRKRAEELADVKQKQLLQADKMASLGILVAGIAHEINNPNNYILLNAQFFKKIWPDILNILNKQSDEEGNLTLGGIEFDKIKDKLDNAPDGIIDGTRRIQKIVKSLTNYARQDVGDLNQRVDINSSIKNTLTIVNNLIKRSTNNFTKKLNKDLPPVKGNRQQLEQVFINLLTNSCQALNSMEDNIKVSSYYNKMLESVIIKIEDDGVGISKKDLKHIFDPFFTTKRDFGGTGLGLSISYNIIKSHGGELNIESAPGKGTVSEVILPVFIDEKKVK